MFVVEEGQYLPASLRHVEHGIGDDALFHFRIVGVVRCCVEAIVVESFQHAVVVGERPSLLQSHLFPMFSLGDGHEECVQ